MNERIVRDAFGNGLFCTATGVKLAMSSVLRKGDKTERWGGGVPSTYWCWEPWLAAKVPGGSKRDYADVGEEPERCVQTGQTELEAEGLLGHGWS